jgi:ketosteroid isomerase-like protein
MSEANVELARRGFVAALRGDFDAVREFLDREVTWHGGDPSAEGACHNRGQALEFMRRARQRRPLGELVEVLDAGDRVVVILRPPAEGDGPADLSASLTTFRDGRAVEMVHFPSVQDAIAAAGL